MSENCRFYFVKREVLHSKVQTGSRNPSAPTVTQKTFCNHDESEHKQGTICPAAICGGDATLCDLSEPYRAAIQEEHQQTSI